MGFVADRSGNTSSRRFIRVNILGRIIALFMLALWLPATQHCNLEAAGLEWLDHADHVASTCNGTCAQDSCHSIEGFSFTKGATTLRVLPAPTAEFCSCLACLVRTTALALESTGFVTKDVPEIQALHRTWSFVRRTSLPARAPNFAV